RPLALGNFVEAEQDERVVHLLDRLAARQDRVQRLAAVDDAKTRQRKRVAVQGHLVAERRHSVVEEKEIASLVTQNRTANAFIHRIAGPKALAHVLLKQRTILDTRKLNAFLQRQRGDENRRACDL